MNIWAPMAKAMGTRHGLAMAWLYLGDVQAVAGEGPGFTTALS